MRFNRPHSFNLRLYSRKIKRNKKSERGGFGALPGTSSPLRVGHSLYSMLPLVASHNHTALFESSYMKNGGERRIRTPETLRFTRFRGARIRPLCHLSKRFNKVPSFIPQLPPLCNSPKNTFWGMV